MRHQPRTGTEGWGAERAGASHLAAEQVACPQMAQMEEEEPAVAGGEGDLRTGGGLSLELLVLNEPILASACTLPLFFFFQKSIECIFWI